MVEMGGLEPPTPYMRSREIDWPGPCCISISGQFSRLLPIFLRTRTASTMLSIEDLSLSREDRAYSHGV